VTILGHGIDLHKVRRVHLIGIGGMHMSAIASILLSRGITVTGSDIAPSRFTERLQREGATVFDGHDANNLGQPDLVVATVAAGEGNPEIRAARARGIPLVIRAEMVAALMEGMRGVCVAGTHGKTTTSSLLAYALVRAGRMPSYLLGGDSVDLDRNAAPGTGPEIVVEADEYAEAFLHYHPSLAIVTNVEVDHLDYYKTEAGITRAFGQFLTQVQAGGDIFPCADSPRLMQILDERGPLAATVHTYALDAPAEWTARVLSTAPEHVFSVQRSGRDFGQFATSLAGRHNVANCLGAIAALDTLGLSGEEIRAAVAGFHGARRRFELTGEAAGVIVVDDYAHHPTEIRATIAAARERFPGRRLVAVFQPHTFSRTEYLLESFRDCFEAADALVLLPTYAARETAEAGLDATSLAAAITKPTPILASGQDDATAQLLASVHSGDVVLTLGAGTVDGVGRALFQELSR
jgi:UDP-N-acetylmuramate--alanine ligase